MAVDISPGVLSPMSFITSDIEHHMSLRTHLLETTLGKQINRPMDCALEIPEIDNQQGGKSHIAWPRTLGLGKHEWVALFNWVRYEDGETISPFWQLLVCLYSWSATGFHEISSAILDDVISISVIWNYWRPHAETGMKRILFCSQHCIYWWPSTFRWRISKHSDGLIRAPYIRDWHLKG